MKSKPIPADVRRDWAGARPALFLLVLLGAFLPAARAIIYYSTSDPNYNTTAPTGALADSGWQWVGYWGGFQAAPISPHHFLAARHVGGSVGDSFVLNGVTYTTTAFYDDAATDLRIWQISGTFPSWAPLYRSSDETGRTLMVFGRGLTRGAEVTAFGALRGWLWGSGDGRLRWGQNTVSSTLTGVSYWGDLLYATFDQSGGANEAHLATGDSSGPVFINDGAGWKLAGVAAAVDGPFNTSPTGTAFNAALFDVRGVYAHTTSDTVWTLITGSSPVPSGLYATRVSARVAWIDTIVPPETPGGDAPLLTPPLLGLLAVLLAGCGIWFLPRPARPCGSAC